MVLVEICVEGAEGAATAARLGVERIELCADLAAGGTTPSAGVVRYACGLGLDVAVLVRPRPGDFIYDASEIAAMLADVQFAREAGAHSVVIGALDRDGSIDRACVQTLCAAARPLQVCFHRAFDATRDPERALDELLELGCDRLLTSGQAAGAAEGLPLLRRLVERAGAALSVMPGGGVRPHNVRAIVAATGAHEVHMSAQAVRRSAAGHVNPELRFRASEPLSEHEHSVTDPDRIRAVLKALSA